MSSSDNRPGAGPHAVPCAVAMGVSAGGLDALSALLPHLPADYPLPVVIVQHRMAGAGDYLVETFSDRCSVVVKEADEKETALAGHVYFAPADYHLLVERDKTFSLTVDDKVNFSRPSIDVLFETAACVWGSDLCGIVLTGASADGAAGLRAIRQQGGMAVVQEPDTAEYPVMPRAAVEVAGADYVLSLSGIRDLLLSWIEDDGSEGGEG